MKTKLLLLVIASLMGGCAATTAQTPAKVERRPIAPGVELLVSEEAGLDSRRIADDVQAQYRSASINAR
jgi:hypothetical protein